MPSKPDLQLLRRRIAAREGVAPGRPALSLDAGALDAALADRGLATGALHELIPASGSDFAATLGFGYALLTRLGLTRPGAILWAVPAHQPFREGALYPAGLAAFGFDPDRVIQLRGPNSRNILWALEEGLAHSALCAVLGLLPAQDRVYDFTASRRLAMRAAEKGVTALLIRPGPAAQGATAARTRWCIASVPGAARHYPGQPMPGLAAPRWRLHLIKCKRGPTGLWEVEWNHETLSFHLVAPLAGQAPLRAPAPAGRLRAAG